MFQNVLVADGSGGELYPADVGVNNGKIVQIGKTEGDPAKRVIDGKGNVLTPGFIDIHSHGDLSAAAFPEMESAVLQGITTVFGGHCGMSASPADRYWRYTFYEEPAFEQVMPPPCGGQWPGRGQVAEVEKLRPAFRKAFGFEPDWSCMGEFYDHLMKVGIGVNLVCVTGHGQIRQQVMGLDDRRFASEAEIGQMKEYLRREMETGSRGMSYGLDYEPGVYASDQELLELAVCLERYDGMLTTHCQRRDYRHGRYQKQYYINGLKEVLDIAERTGVRLHVSHLNGGYEVTPPDEMLQREAAKRTLDLIESYKARGVRVTWDVIPPGCGGEMFHFPHLATKMVPYVEQCGGLGSFAGCLQTESYRRELSRSIQEGKHLSRSPFTNLDPVQSPDWGMHAVITDAKDRSLIGKNIGELAKERGQHFVDTILDLLREDPWICYTNVQELPRPDWEYFVAQKDAAVCLDGGVYNMNYPTVKDYPTEYAAPSTYCGMVKFLKGQLDQGKNLAETIAKMTGNPARKIGLPDRGFIQEGMAADLVLLDVDHLDPRENRVDPRQVPEGIQSVIVNGVMEAEQGKCLHQKAGRTLRYPFKEV